MSYGTYLRTDLYFNRQTFNTKYQVEEELGEVRKSITDLKTAIFELATMTEPSKFFKPEPGEDYPEFYLDSINKRMDYLLGELHSAYIDEYKLSLLLDEWEGSHDRDNHGYAIDLPEGEEGKSYVFGDFVETVTDNDLIKRVETDNTFSDTFAELRVNDIRENVKKLEEQLKKTGRRSTGVYDRNGKEIAEGDIFVYLKYSNLKEVPSDLIENYDEKYSSEVMLHAVFWDDEHCAFCSDVHGDCDLLSSYEKEYLVVVTNNIEHPELYNY